MKHIILRLLGLAAVAGTGVTGLYSHVQSGVRLPTAEAYASARLLVVNAQLRDARPGYIFIAGDSQAELLNPRLSCDRDVVNGGVSGTTVEVYRRIVDRLDFSNPPGAMLVVIGTNNLLRKQRPLSPEALSRFEEEASALLTQLLRVTSRVFVAAIPPVSEDARTLIEFDASKGFSEQIRVLCDRLGCEHFDPFASIRSADFGVARAGSTDVLRLKSYRDAYDLYRDCARVKPRNSGPEKPTRCASK